MTTTCNALKSLGNDDLIECFHLAVQMNLELDFLILLKAEIDHRQLTGLLQTIEVPLGNGQAPNLNSSFN